MVIRMKDQAENPVQIRASPSSVSKTCIDYLVTLDIYSIT